MIYEIPEGTTEPQDFQLLDTVDGVTTPIVATGMTLGLVLIDANGDAVDTASKVAFVEAATGKVRFSPASDDFLAALSPYRFRWSLTAGGKVGYAPNTFEPDTWLVNQ